MSPSTPSERWWVLCPSVKKSGRQVWFFWLKKLKQIKMMDDIFRPLEEAEEEGVFRVESINLPQKTLKIIPKLRTNTGSNGSLHCLGPTPTSSHTPNWPLALRPLTMVKQRFGERHHVWGGAVWESGRDFSRGSESISKVQKIRLTTADGKTC